MRDWEEIEKPRVICFASMLRRFLALFRVVAGSAGRSAFQRAAPLYFAIVVVASILFSPQGMRAQDVITLGGRSLAFRLTLLGLWLLAATPAARAVLHEPALLILRSLPVPRWHFHLSQGMLLFLVESPWFALHLRGAGVLSGIAAAGMAMAAHLFIVARPRRIFEGLAALLILVAAVQPLPAPYLLIGAVLLMPLGFRAAFLRAAERSAYAGPPLVRGPALIALGMAYLLTLWRGHGALLLRALLLSLLGVAISTLALRNNQILETELRATVLLGVLSAPLLLGACGLAGPVLRSEQQASWLLEICGLRGARRVLGTVLPVALFTTLLGTLAGIGVGWLLAGTPQLLLRLGTGAFLQGAAIGVIASTGLRFTQRGDKKDSDRLLLLILFLIFCAALLTWVLHEVVIGAYWAAAIVFFDRAAASASPRGRWLRLRQERRQGEAS